LLSLVNIKTGILNERVYFLLFAGGVTSLEVIKDIQVLAGRQKIKEDVMLGADAHELTDLVHLFEHVNVVAPCVTLRFLD